MKTKPYKCTDCQEITLLKDNGEITVGYCSRCGHPLWNPSEEQTEKHMKIPFEVKDKLYKILQKRQCNNKPYPEGAGLQCADFNETTSEMLEYLKEFLRDELIKYEAHRRIDRATHAKEFEFAEQAVDNYLDPPCKKTLSDEQILKLAEIYGTNTDTRVCVAQVCDEVLDRSGELLGIVRDIYRKKLK